MNCSEENEIYPLTMEEIAEAQRADAVVGLLALSQRYSTIEEVEACQL
jgi:hypothetical protein